MKIFGRVYDETMEEGFQINSRTCLIVERSRIKQVVVKKGRAPLTARFNW